MAKTPARRTLVIVLGSLAAILALPGCKSRGEVQVAPPDKLYGEAAQDLRANNYKAAIQKLESLESHYPFTNAAKQGQLDLMFAYYKNGEGESAVDQADQFIRENPTHPRVDYAYYIKGLVYYESGAGWLEQVFHADVNKRPPHEAAKALQAFQMLLQQFPKSPYAIDARQRMIFLRNKLAAYELAVAEYYVKRAAYVAALNRARDVIEQYDGSPAALEALKVMSVSYRKLGMDDLAKVSDSVYAANVTKPNLVAPTAVAAGLSPGQSADIASGAGSYGPQRGQWEAKVGMTYSNAATTGFKGGTKVDVQSGVGFAAGVGYHFTNRLSASANLTYDTKSYTANVVGDTAGAVYPIKGDLTTTSLMVDGSYNFLTGRWSPFVTAGLGWSWVDTNVATGPPTVGCWWSPWYGYICTAWQKTKTETGFAYEAGAGLRYDFNNIFAAEALYHLKWISFSNATGTPSYDGFQVNLDWKF